MENNTSGLCMPTRAASYPAKGLTSMSTGPQENLTSASVMGNTSIAPSLTNVLWQGSGDVGLVNIQADLGRFNNVRAEYLTHMLESDYPDANNSYLHTCPIVQNQNY